MPENITTLGFEFDSKKTHTKLSNLIKKFDELESKGKSTKDALKEVFTTIVPDIDTGTNKMRHFALALTTSARAAQKISRSISTVNKSLNQLNLKALNPLPANAAQNLERNSERMINSLNKVGSRIQSALAQINVRPINPVAEDAVQRVERMARALAQIKPVTIIKEEQLKRLTRIENALNRLNKVKIPAPDSGKVAKSIKNLSTVNNELSVMAIHADAGMVAINGLTNSLTGKFFIDAIRNATELGQELAMIKSIAGEFNTDVIREGLLSLPSVLGKTADNAHAFYEAYSSGIQGTEHDLLKFTETNAKLAKTIRADVTATMDAVTTTMNAYGLSVEKAGYVSDIFFNIVKYGKANGQQLATGLGQVVSTARTAGLSLEELGASITVLSKIMQSRNAITYLNNMLSKMINPTKKARDTMQKYGIQLGLATVKAEGFNNLLRKIYSLAQQDQSVLLEFFPDARGQRAALQLLGEGYSDLQRQMLNFRNSSGEMEKAFRVIEGDIHVQLAALPNTFRKISESAGLAATEILTFGGALQPLLHMVNNMNSEFQKHIGIFTLGIATYSGYKAIMLTITSLQAMMAKNEEILAAKKVQQNAATQALIASDTRYAILSQKNNLHLIKQAELTHANAVAIEVETREKQRQFMYDSASLPFGERNIKALKWATAVRKAHAAAILAENEAKNKANLLDAMQPTQFSLGQTAVSNAKVGAETAKNAALNATALREQAIATGDLATANKLGKQAQEQWNLAQSYSQIAANASTRRRKTLEMRIKANTIVQKNNTLATRVNAAAMRLSAKAMNAFGIGLDKAKIAVIKFSVALKALTRAAIPLVILGIAIEGLMMAFERLDLSGQKMLESFRENLSKMEANAEKQRSAMEKAAERENAYAERMINSAKTIMVIANATDLSAEQFDKVKGIVSEINEYLGESVVKINSANKSVSYQADLLKKIENKKRQEEDASIQRQIKYTAVMRRMYQTQLEKLNKSRTGWNYASVDAEMTAVSAKIAEEKNKAEELWHKYYAMQSAHELQNLSQIAELNEKILKLNERIAKIKKEVADADKTDGQLIFDIDEQIKKSKAFMQPFAEYKARSNEIEQYKKQYELWEKGQQFLQDYEIFERKTGIKHDRSILEGLFEQKYNQKMQWEIPVKPQVMSPQEKAQLAESIGITLPKVAFTEEEYRKELINYAKLNQEKLRILKKVYDGEKRLADDLEKSRINWQRQYFENQLSFAKDDKERIKLLHKESRSMDYGGTGIRPANTFSTPKEAEEYFGRYYSLVKKRYDLQNKQEQALAAAAKKANSEMVKLIASLDKFKSFSVQGVSSNSTEALKLQSRSFASLPKFTAESTKIYSDAQQKRNDSLQKLISDWQKSLVEAFSERSLNLAKTEEKIDEVKKVLSEGIKVTVKNDLFELHTVN